MKQPPPPIYPAMDRDLLFEVLRVYVDGEEKKRELAATGLRLDVGSMEAPGVDPKRDDRWMLDALSADKPFYGYDEVLPRLHVRMNEPVVTPSVVVEVKKATTPHQANKRKCWTCRSRLALAPISCKCGYTFCHSHRYPEMHNCSFDYKRDGKRKLELLNQPFRSTKLVRV
ncbi:hypothetical protein SPRG_02620 [Saprolegnia parasitica CBS 223.65]|uniref:AN1-type domain-containing protein n=1 Tax=Saprolegnia parasitica (strain CBS 223.65) TaxID=695850 RepID=A0A067D1L6_SAPPC|nr:hypothetical protein SPRG_02620 [Saprolegnia parasitica CBS 223.65]KDO32927.1 hypothetical protein SPRG_02620 [Saprolegnia parasitica CBS 223.65]|eukprot:XP_012196574.1 hypothetical protein SPRG_02620 [Saprolegnia parasitica CBS 223.65]